MKIVLETKRLLIREMNLDNTVVAGNPAKFIKNIE